MRWVLHVEHTYSAGDYYILLYFFIPEQEQLGPSLSLFFYGVHTYVHSVQYLPVMRW